MSIRHFPVATAVGLLLALATTAVAGDEDAAEERAPALVEIEGQGAKGAEGDGDRLTLAGRLEMKPAEAFAWFTEPAKLARWWAPKLTIEPKVGGRYEPSWPDRGMKLTGEITAYDPGRRLAYTWVWAHTPEDAGPFDVEIRFAAHEEGGTKVTISHGPYDGSDAHAKERAGHRAGWLHFFGVLAGIDRETLAEEGEDEQIEDAEVEDAEIEDEEVEVEEVEDPRVAAELAADVARLARQPEGEERDEVLRRILSRRPGWTDLTRAIEAISFPERETGTVLVKSVEGPDGVERPWVLSVPERYDPRRPTPLLVVLHGGVSRPTIPDDPAAYATGPSPLSVLARRHGWLAAFPMGQAGATWWDDVGIANVRRIVRAVKRAYHVDDDRVWLGGFSDGASGAFLYAMLDSSDYAGLVALNGHLGVGSLAGGIPTFASNMANVPVYATTTHSDALYPTERMRPTIQMAMAAGAQIRYRAMPGGHRYEPMYAELPALGRWLEGRVREPLPARVVCETSDPKHGRQRWFAIDAVDADAPRAGWHRDHNVELTDTRISIGFYHDQGFAGVRVDRVVEGSLAAEMGLAAGDVITRADDDTEIGSIEDLTIYKATLSRGQEITLHVERGGEEVALTGKIPPPESYQLFQGDRESAKAVATIAGNVVRVKASRVGAFRVFVHPDLVRLDQPLEIVVNGETVFDELVRPDPEYLLASFLAHRDRRLLYVAEIAIDLGEEDVAERD